MTKKRGFEWTNEQSARIEKASNLKKLSEEKPVDINTDFTKVLELELPKRSTASSAGYDFQASEYVTIPSVWKQATKYIYNKVFNPTRDIEEKIFKPKLVPTGVKSYMPEDEYLALYNRSSNPLKRFLVLANGVGVIDSDYYGNPDNDGHIMFQFINFGISDVTIAPGDKIGQGIFQEFRKADGDSAEGQRTSGFGSTGK